MSARDRMIQSLSDAKASPTVQRERARRAARAAISSARQQLLLSRTVQRHGDHAFTLDARLDAAVERVMGGQRHDPTRAGKAAKRLRSAHAEASALLAQLQQVLDAAPAEVLDRMTGALRTALEALEEAIEARA